MRTCRACPNKLYTENAWQRIPKEQRANLLANGYNMHGGRGLCNRCYWYAANNHTLDNHERLTRSADELLDDYALLRAEGHKLADIANRLGITFQALDKALCRNRHDPRARRPRQAA